MSEAVRLVFLSDPPASPLVDQDFGVQVGADKFGQEIEIACSLVYASDSAPASAASNGAGGRNATETTDAVVDASGRPILVVRVPPGPSSTESSSTPGSMTMAYTGQLTFRATILESSKQHGNRAMRLVITGRIKTGGNDDGDSGGSREVLSVVSPAFRVMRCVRARLPASLGEGGSFVCVHVACSSGYRSSVVVHVCRHHSANK